MSRPKYADSMEGQIAEGVSPLGDALREAVGAAPGDTVTFRTPQFARPAHWPAPGGPPSTREGWDALREMPRDALRELGLGSWDGRLMLFPGEWYAKIPAGLPVECISGETSKWGPDHDDDVRFGCLAYGVPAIDGVEVVAIREARRRQKRARAAGRAK